MKSKRVILSLLSLIIVLGLVACSENNNDDTNGDQKVETKVMKIGTGISPNHFLYEAMEMFKEHVETNTEGQIKVELYHSGQLGDDVELLNAIKLGTATGTFPSDAKMGNIVKEFNLLSLPFIIPNDDVANKIATGSWGQELLKKLEPAGYKGLGLAHYGFRQLTNNIRSVESVEDFKGLKLRTMESATHLDVFRALGANPTPMAWGEVYTSLQQGVLDGQENPTSTIYSNKIQEVQKYLSLTGHVYTFLPFVISKDFFDNLTEEQQKIVQEAGDIAIEHTRESVVEDNEAAIAKLEEAGMIINDVDDETKKEMYEKVKPVLDKYGKEGNGQFYQELLDEVAKYF